jgi:hypothetical protein
MTITIDREQRHVLWADLVADLTGIDDVYRALDHGEWAKAQALRCRFEEDMRVLDDIGWARDDNESETYAITVAPEALRRTIERLYVDCERFAGEQLLETSLDDTMRSIRTYGALLNQLAQATDGDQPADA